MTGAEAAREILDRAGLNNVPVEEVPGHLTVIKLFEERNSARFVGS